MGLIQQVPRSYPSSERSPLALYCAPALPREQARSPASASLPLASSLGRTPLPFFWERSCLCRDRPTSPSRLVRNVITPLSWFLVFCFLASPRGLASASFQRSSHHRVTLGLLFGVLAFSAGLAHQSSVGIYFYCTNTRAAAWAVIMPAYAPSKLIYCSSFCPPLSPGAYFYLAV